MLQIEGLTRRFGDVTAVDHVSLAIESGSFTGVIGRSGAGKSTLLRMINRLVTASEGRILFDGADVTKFRGTELLEWRTRCAMIFQQFNLIGRLDVFSNVMIGRINHMPAWRSLIKLWPTRDRAIVLSALELFDIGQLAAQRAQFLSGGQQQRVAIARALVQEPAIVLADEPIASLDPRNTKIVMDTLARINREFGITILCNLHSVDIAKAYCGRLIGMSSGRVVFDGPPSALTQDIARGLYGIEAPQVLDGAALPAGEQMLESDPRAVASAVRH
jgi:phosphonate transport system ATP-binding protein